MGAGTGVTQAAGTARKRQSGQAPLRGAADLPRMWECVHSYDSLLERQEPCGICVPWVSPEWKILLLSHRIREEVLDAAVQAYAQTVREQCAEEVKKLAQLQKNVGVEETDPRRPPFCRYRRKYRIWNRR